MNTLYSKFSDGVPDSGETDLKLDFIERFFENEREFASLVDEIDAEATSLYIEHIKPLHREYRKEERGIGPGEISVEVAKRYYALLRKLQPDVVVETGVANGYSTAVLLAALETNDKGHLYSVDYPFYSDEDAETYRKELDYNTPYVDTIPGDKDVGWVIPDEYRKRWTLRTGLSQRELPRLLIETITEIDVFIHDSEHSFPCMMFEFELAWHHLSSGGLILSDDLHMNRAFELFVSERGGEAGRLHRHVGYFIPE